MHQVIPVDILAVDDNANNLRSLEALLSEIPGARLVFAHSGDEALMFLLRQEFALILLDVQMPSLDGYETAQLIRSRERTRHIPIIFLTALNRSEVSVNQGYSLGAVDFLFKPIVPEILRSKVNVFLDLYRKANEVKRQELLLRDAERREHERSLAEARQQYERSLLKDEADRDRRMAEALHVKAQELSRLVDQKEEAERRLQLLADTASALLMGPRQTLSQVYQRVTAHLGLEVHVEFRVDAPSTLALASHSGVHGEQLGHLKRIAFGQGVAGMVALEGRRLVMDHSPRPDDFPDELARAAGLVSSACYPLVMEDRVLGTATFGTSKPRTFTPDEIALMQGVCDQVAAALERDRLIEELHDRDRRKDEFLAMLGHELRNPLAPIRSAIEVVRLSVAHDVKLARAMQSAERQVGHMTRLVDDLLDVSRITRGKVELRMAPVTLARLVDQAVQATEPLFRECRHTLTVELPPEPIHLVVDATRITQVLANLLNNAAKYTMPGGRVLLRAERAPGQLTILVRDNGIGIRPEMLPKVFDIFVQVDPTSDRAKGGLGLGLTLVRSLVAMHDGSVEAHSGGLGRGSEFVVRLPVMDAQDEVAEPRRESLRPAPLSPLYILLVEDNPDIRSTMKDLLELNGHEVEEAADGELAVSMALLRTPQVALVDIGLPGLDGYTVAERIRSAANGALPRLVALTGYGTPDVTRRAEAAGFDAHLVKPVSFEELSRVLHRLFPANSTQGV